MCWKCLKYRIKNETKVMNYNKAQGWDCIGGEEHTLAPSRTQKKGWKGFTLSYRKIWSTHKVMVIQNMLLEMRKLRSPLTIYCLQVILCRRNFASVAKSLLNTPQKTDKAEIAILYHHLVKKSTSLSKMLIFVSVKSSLFIVFG